MNKKELRKKYIEKRNSLTFSDKSLLEKSILDIFDKQIAFTNTITSCFLPIVSKNELDTWPIIQSILSRNGKVAFTVWDDESHSLTHRSYTKETILVENSYGIPEPINGEVISTDQLDYVLVPLVIADSNGNRIGYGKGVYDRFLSTCEPKTRFIGISLFELIDNIEGVDKFDIPLHYCITPTKIHSFEK